MDVRGRLPFSSSIGEWRASLLASGVREMPVDGAMAERSADFPVLRGDPADRVILACAAVERCTLLTSDDRLLSWRGPLLRQDARR
jgi:PIN domain nuclease of toxin-antitoxin system